MKVATQLAGTRLSFLKSSDVCVTDGNDDLIAPTHCVRHSVCAAMLAFCGLPLLILTANFMTQGVRKDACRLMDDDFVYITRQVYQIVYLLKSTVGTKMGKHCLNTSAKHKSKLTFKRLISGTGEMAQNVGSCEIIRP